MQRNTNWKNCKRILCVRPDNMGDVLMSAPAMRALKETFGCHITLLTSTAGTAICEFLAEVDEVITFDLPWVKVEALGDAEAVMKLVEKLSVCSFDAAIIFSVYSQNPLPAAMLTYLAGIPKRLAYCRENPYYLLTDWLPDEEPYSYIRHQVRRDLHLVESVGASVQNEKLSISIPDHHWPGAQQKLQAVGLDTEKKWMVLHAGVSERKREFPVECWIETARKIIRDLGYQVLFTGSKNEKNLADTLAALTGEGGFSAAGKLTLTEFISVTSKTSLLISVNTGPVHIAAAVNTPVIVLYAATNPQHLPWKAVGKAFIYDVPEHLRSKNEIIRFVHDHVQSPAAALVKPEEIVQAASQLLRGESFFFPELTPLRYNG